MKFSYIELPSNRRFGLFFTFVFCAFGIYIFQYLEKFWFAYLSLFVSLVLLFVTIFKAELLLPFNNL